VSIVRIIERWAQSQPDRDALRADGEITTWRRLWNRVERASARLQGEWGVACGDRVAYLGLNRADEIILLLALARIGAMLVPLNYRLAQPELAAIIKHCGATHVVHDSEHAERARALAKVNGARVFALIDLIAEYCPHQFVALAPVEDEPLLLCYTSGTTGDPKGVVHSERGMLSNAYASIAAHDLVSGDHVLTVLPLFHVGGLCIQTLPALVAGACVTLHARFEAGAFLDAVRLHRPSLTLMVPATLRAIIDHPNWSGADLSSLRLIMAGSSIIPRPFIDAIHAAGVPLGQIYGTTETGPVSVVLRAGQARDRPGFAGWPANFCDVRIVDDTGRDVLANEVGELWIRGDNVMLGYYGGPRGAGLVDGWFHTGDLARADQDGCIEVVGRAREMIISGGENIYPAEVENVLLGIEGVAEASVIGMPDERWGEVPVAVVVARSGAALDLEQLREACAMRLAKYKVPRTIHVIDVLPRNAMGKVQAAQLRSQLGC
jgi:fatty-acyl-CoA synthase